MAEQGTASSVGATDQISERDQAIRLLLQRRKPGPKVIGRRDRAVI
jgi:hypothetical protein